MAQTKFAAFDIDGTLFRWQLFHELVFTLKDMGCFDDETSKGLDKAFLAWRGWNMSFDEYEMYVVRAIENNLSTIPPNGFDRAAKTIVEKSGHKVYKYTRDLIVTLKAQGYHVIALSGSQQEIIEPFAELYGFDSCIGALYERKNGMFTGKKIRHIQGNKAALLKEYVAAHELTFDGSVAVGDSAGDIAMLEIVEQPIAFNPAYDLLERAMTDGWRVVIERKNVAYELGKGQDGLYILEKTDRL